MFQFRRFPTYTYLFSIRYMDIVHVGCPIRKSPDIALVYSSPRLIAVSHVLLRLPVPRHSPCALYSLTFLRLSTLMWSSFVLNKKWIVVLIINFPIFLKHIWIFKTVSIYVLSLVCLFFVQFSRCVLWIFVKFRFQHSFTNKCWNLTLTSAASKQFSCHFA